MTEKTALKISTLLAGFAFLMTLMNVNSTCLVMMHQPKLPEGSEKLRKGN
ncbi:MAG: cyclic lactone autoinducer peptide [Senegalia sp. (in: firmicutes)]